ncbi:MAG TPA: aldehyde dehydrogenase [Acidimicrobiales bacterium]|jgi:aldehyde dehydrogenase (NAD+)|nr:aldehyde dehydrogenase [Acidimicrobiales bacterium]
MSDTSLWSEERMLVGGRLVDAADGATFENVNPATEEVIGVVADGSEADMRAAIAAARSAFDDTIWSTDVSLRLRCLRQLHDGLLRHAEELRPTLVAEVGCPVLLTHGPQLVSPTDSVAWVADLLEKYQWEEDLGVAEPFGVRTRRTLRREPIGVVGAITPWNFPVQINLAKCVPALAAGNTVVLKPAPDTPWAATLLGRIVAEETDLPDGVLNIVTSSDHLVGQLLAEDPRVDMVSFTGSTATGRKVMSVAAPTIKKVFLELGGKSAFIVLDDADVASAVVGVAFQITTHAGQGCAVTSRLLLPRSRFDEGLEAVVQAVGAMSYGDPTDPSTMMGPLVSERQRQRVLGYIETGVAEGAEVALGGGIPSHLPRGFYVQPTVLVNVGRDTTVAQEEIFGPVLVVQPHDGDDDAVHIANDSIYGLSGAVVGGSIERARAVARRMRTGTVSVNGGVYYSPDVPFGGYRQSGVGREMGQAGFEEYLEMKALAEGA